MGTSFFVFAPRVFLFCVFSCFLFCVFSVLLYKTFFYKAKILLQVAISAKEPRASE